MADPTREQIEAAIATYDLTDSWLPLVAEERVLIKAAERYLAILDAPTVTFAEHYSGDGSVFLADDGPVDIAPGTYALVRLEDT